MLRLGPHRSADELRRSRVSAGYSTSSAAGATWLAYDRARGTFTQIRTYFGDVPGQRAACSRAANVVSEQSANRIPQRRFKRFGIMLLQSCGVSLPQGHADHHVRDLHAGANDGNYHTVSVRKRHRSFFKSSSVSLVVVLLSASLFSLLLPSIRSRTVQARAIFDQSYD